MNVEISVVKTIVETIKVIDKYTFITNYQYGEKTDVLQIDAVSMKVAMNQWVDALNFPHIGNISKSKAKQHIYSGDIEEIPLKKLHHISCLYEKVNGKIIEAYIVQHCHLPSELQTFNIIVLFKGGTYVRQIQADGYREAIRLWGKYLSWHFYNSIERQTIKEVLKNNFEDLINSLMPKVWSFSLVVDNSILEMFIVEC